MQSSYLIWQMHKEPIFSVNFVMYICNIHCNVYFFFSHSLTSLFKISVNVRSCL